MFRYFKRNWKLLTLMLAAICATAFFQIAAQFIKGKITELAIGGEISLIFQNSAVFAVLIVAHMLFHQIYTNLRINLSANIIRDLKNDVMDSALSLKRTDARALDKASVVTRYTTNIGKIEYDFLMMGSKLFEYIITIVAVSAALFSVNYKIATLSLAVFVLPVFAVEALKNKLSRSEQDYIDENKTHTAKLLKNLAGMEAIKNYGIEKEISQKYRDSLDSLRATDMRRAKIRSISNGFSFLVTMLSQAAIVIFSAFQLMNRSISVGDFVTIFSLTALLKPAFYWISKLYESVISSRPAITSVLDEITTESNKPEQLYTHITDSEYAINIEDLCFGYDTNIFDKFSLNVRRGEKVLITGESGSGKSTLIDLMTKFLTPTSGRIELCSPAVVFRQDAFIFNADAVNNITMFKNDIPEESLLRAAKICGVSEIIENNPLLAENGSSLSGGEKKRMSLARTLLSDSEILILDEPLANIDPASIAKIEEAIISDSEHTIVIVTHQVSDRLLSCMDQVIRIGGEK